MTELYIVGNLDGGAMLQCQRNGCRVPGSCASGLCWWTEDLPWNATLEQVSEAYVRHLATHSEGPLDITELDQRLNWLEQRVAILEHERKENPDA